MGMKRMAALCFVFLMTVAGLRAEPRLPGFFSDNMVLQREKPVKGWGWAEAGEKVTGEFAGQKLSSVTAESGRWSVSLKEMDASTESRELKVSSEKVESPIILTNVVVGDVWLCSGQSNMEWSLSRAANKDKEIAAANFSQIRHVKFAHIKATQPKSDIKATWVVCSPKTAGSFTAVGYFFGRALHKELGVPIGLIGSNWGGTHIEPWLSIEGLAMTDELKELYDAVAAADPSTEEGKAAHAAVLKEMRAWIEESEKSLEKGEAFAPMPSLPVPPGGRAAPMQIFNAMISPITPFAIRGAIWYQGESNGKEGVSYFHKKKALIEGWRKLWGQGEFPFYFVQLANFQNPTDTPEGGDGWARLREAQRKSLTIPNTGMAVAIDLADAANPRNIHPGNKQDVGGRLALWALANEYDRKDLVCSGPLYESHTVKGSTIRIKFDYVGKGLMVGKKVGLEPAVEDKGEEAAEGEAVEMPALKQFAVAGNDKKWFWADAKIEGDEVVVSCPDVPQPVAVRYAYRMNPAGCNLYNRAGLPASPFRTDDW
jgi:sialate O-acetylesterase